MISEEKRSFSEPRRRLIYLNLLFTTAALGCLLGMFDFVLCELSGHRSIALDYVFYKPNFFSPSPLLIHLMLTAAISCSIFQVFVLLHKSPWRPKLRFSSAFQPIALSIIATGLLMILFRFFKDSVSTFFVFALLAFTALLTAIARLVEHSHEESSLQESKRARAMQVLVVSVGAAFSLSAFLAPDVHALVHGSPLHAAQELPRGRPDVMLIVLDTVRADRLSCYGNTMLSTPNIDSLARQGLLFLNAFSTAPWTVPSHASMFTGLYTSQHHANWDSPYLRNEFVTLAERLTKAGYATAGFSENPYVGAGNGFAQGFGEFHETWRRPILERALNTALRPFVRRDEREYAPRTTSLAFRWLDANHSDTRPFFVFLNLMAAHLPNYPRSSESPTQWPEDLLKRIEPVNTVPAKYYLPQYRLNGNELRVMAEIYDGEILYLDGHVGRVINFLKKSEMLENTIIILTSDHGENFGEHGFFEHNFCLYNSLIHVPLVLYSPRSIEPTIIQERVSNAAIMSTILDLAGIPENDVPLRDRKIPLNRMTQDQMVVAELPSAVRVLRDIIGDESSNFNYAPFDQDLRCVILGDYKYIWSSNGNHELYSMRDDFAEEKNLLQSHEATARELRDALDQWKSANQPESHSITAPGVDAAASDALRTPGNMQ